MYMSMLVDYPKKKGTFILGIRKGANRRRSRQTKEQLPTKQKIKRL